MGKVRRNCPIVISSSDDDKDFIPRTNLGFSKSVPSRRNSKRAKRISLSNSSSAASKLSDLSGFSEVKRLCEEFNHGSSHHKVSSGSGIYKDLWVNKYKPPCLGELAVHKKKVEEVKMWFEERLRNSGVKSQNNVILISGPAGVGKSATIYALATHLGAEVCEWNTPTPTIWQEHLHTSNSGIRYTSKMDEFEIFVERIRKYGSVSSSFTSISRPVIILIDDIPAVNGKISYGRLHKCLDLLLQSARIPTAILINECGKSDSVENNTRYWEELQSSLQDAGAFKVSFNPITVNSIKKTLSNICRAERFAPSDECIDLIAKISAGDIRHAITSLQYLSVTPHLVQSFSDPKRNSENETDGFLSSFGKDATLSLFHALGKFLHNKRELENFMASDRDVIVLKQKFMRCPMKMDVPEMVLYQAHGQARLVTDFLHENVLDFLNEEATEDACTLYEYLSDADCLLASLSGTLSRKNEAENVIQSTAASIAVRGVLFGNTNPVSSRWHAIRRPKLWEVELSSLNNKHDMLTLCRNGDSSMRMNKLSTIATEFRPVLNCVGHRVSEETEDLSDMSIDEWEEIEEDDIEEW